MEQLTKIYIEQGKPELASLVENFTKSVRRLGSLSDQLWAINEHRCPSCNRAKTDPVEIEFMDRVGMCLTCDSVSNDTCECGNPTSYESDFCEDCL